MIVMSVTLSKTFQECLNMSISPDQLFTSWTYDEDWMQRLRPGPVHFYESCSVEPKCLTWSPTKLLHCVAHGEDEIIQSCSSSTFQMLSDWTDQILTAKTHCALKKHVHSFTAASFTMWTYGKKYFGPVCITWRWTLCQRSSWGAWFTPTLCFRLLAVCSWDYVLNLNDLQSTGVHCRVQRNCPEHT